MRLRNSTQTIFILLIALTIVSACESALAIPTPGQVNTTVPAIVPAVDLVITHPELEVISPENVYRLEPVDQIGQGHVYGIALSPDGSYFAVSTTTGVYLYDSKTARQTGFINLGFGAGKHVEGFVCPTQKNLAFSPDGKTLAIADKDVTLWDLRNNSPLSIIKNKIIDAETTISRIHFSVDGTRIIGIQQKAFDYPCYLGIESLVIYRVDSGELLFKRDLNNFGEDPSPAFYEKDGVFTFAYRDSKTNEYSRIEVDLNGKILAESPSPEIDSMSKRWGIRKGWKIDPEREEYFPVAHIIDLSSFEEIEKINANIDYIPHTEKMIILEDQKLTIRTTEGKPQCSQNVNASARYSHLPFAISFDGKTGLSQDSDGKWGGKIRVWDLEKCAISEPILELPEIVGPLRFSADGRSILTGSHSGPLFHVFDAATGKIRFTLPGEDAEFSANGRQVYIVDEKGIKAYGIDTGKFEFQILTRKISFGSDLVVSPNGRIFFLYERGTTNCSFYKIEEDMPFRSQPCPFLDQVIFSKDRNLVVTVYDKPDAFEYKFWDTFFDRELLYWHSLVPALFLSNSVFTSDFSKLALQDVNGTDASINLWSVPAFSIENKMPASLLNGSSLTLMEFTVDNKLLLIIGTEPDALLFWDISKKNTLYVIPAEIQFSMNGFFATFSPDGRMLLILDDDETIHVWGVKKK